MIIIYGRKDGIEFILHDCFSKIEFGLKKHAKLECHGNVDYKLILNELTLHDCKQILFQRNWPFSQSISLKEAKDLVLITTPAFCSKAHWGCKWFF